MYIVRSAVKGTARLLFAFVHNLPWKPCNMSLLFNIAPIKRYDILVIRV